jgi:hypothetical protein
MTTQFVQPTGYKFTFWNDGRVTWASVHASEGAAGEPLAPMGRDDAEAIISALREQFRDDGMQVADDEDLSQRDRDLFARVADMVLHGPPAERPRLGVEIATPFGYDDDRQIIISLDALGLGDFAYCQTTSPGGDGRQLVVHLHPADDVPAGCPDDCDPDNR